MGGTRSYVNGGMTWNHVVPSSGARISTLAARAYVRTHRASQRVTRYSTNRDDCEGGQTSIDSLLFTSGGRNHAHRGARN